MAFVSQITSLWDVQVILAILRVNRHNNASLCHLICLVALVQAGRHESETL